MPQHIKLYTDFDITNTGVVRNFKKDMIPAKINGRMIQSESEWRRCRRQQTNWETVIQIISLRTQPLNIRTISSKSGWLLEFDIESTDVYLKDGDKLGILKEDFNNVPLLTGLEEIKGLNEFLTVDQNIRFETYEL